MATWRLLLTLALIGIAVTADQAHQATAGVAAGAGPSDGQDGPLAAQTTQQVNSGDTDAQQHGQGHTQHSQSLDSTSPDTDTAAGTQQPGEAALTSDASPSTEQAAAASQEDTAAVATQDAEPAAQPPIPPPPVPRDPIPFNMSELVKLLNSGRDALYGNETARNVTEGVRYLSTLTKLVHAYIPMPARERRRLQPPAPAQPTGTGAAGTAGLDAAQGGADSGVQTGAEAEGAEGADPVLQAALSGSETEMLAEAMQEELFTRSNKWRDTGLRVAAQASFTLTALRVAGVLPKSLGRGTTDNVVHELHRLSLAGSTEAALALADRFFKGTGVTKSCKLGSLYAKLAASQITADAEKEGRFATAISPADLRERHVNAWYQSAEELENAAHVVHMEEDMAIRGNADAQRRMAYRRLMGRGIEANPEAAFHDFTAGAAQGDPYAIFNLGYMYLKGLFVAQNYTEARKLFLQAAEKGFAPGWNGLGVMYWHGQGGEVNMTMAVEMFRKGAAANQSDAVYNLATLTLSGLYVDKNLTLAAEMFVKAHELGHWRAAYQLALMHEEGVGFNQSCTRAEHYYRAYFVERSTWSKSMSAADKAVAAGDHWGGLLQYLELAEQGHAAAAVNAAWMLRHGQGYSGPGFLDLASWLFLRAAQQNHTTAAVELGHMTMEATQLGLSHSSNPTLAVQWWTHAAGLNDSEAMFLVGWAHQHGIGTPNNEVNRTLARHMYTQSIKTGKGLAGRSLAPHLALFSMAVDDVLSPFVGQGATARLLAWLKQRFVMVEHRTPAGVVSSVAGAKAVLGGAANSSTQVAWEQELQRVVHMAAAWIKEASKGWQGVDVASGENVLFSCLLGGLIAVLVMRRRRLEQHTRSMERLQGMAPAADSSLDETLVDDAQDSASVQGGGSEEQGAAEALPGHATATATISDGKHGCGDAGCKAQCGHSKRFDIQANSSSSASSTSREDTGSASLRHRGNTAGSSSGDPSGA